MNELKNCCVCLTNINLKETTIKDESNELSYYDKLKTNINEINWQPTDLICDTCMNILNIVHNFRQTCLKSDQIRTENLLKDEDSYGISTDLICNESSTEDEKKVRKTKKTRFKLGRIRTKKQLKHKNNYDIASESIFNESSSEDEKEEKPKRIRRNGNIQFKCQFCSLKFTSSKLLINHCVEEHKIANKNVRPFSCEMCDSRFNNSSNLVQHMKYHEAVRSNVCSFCGKGFITRQDLNTHEKQHLNKREYQCEICSKSFNTNKDLRSHKLVVHTDPVTWKFHCKICDKRFPIKSNYDAHMRRHAGDKRFECNLCNKRFTDKCVLQRHMRTHSNVREWKCTDCAKEYKDKRALQIHMAKAHGIGLGQIKLPNKEPKYSCHICSKSYFAKNKLTRHLCTHSGEKPFSCSICHKRFVDKSYVTQHMKKYHNLVNLNVG